MLAASQKITGAAQGEVFVCEFDAIGGGAEGLEARSGLLVPGSGDEDTVGLRAAAPDAAS